MVLVVEMMEKLMKIDGCEEEKRLEIMVFWSRERREVKEEVLGWWRRVALGWLAGVMSRGRAAIGSGGMGGRKKKLRKKNEREREREGEVYI